MKKLTFILALIVSMMAIAAVADETPRLGLKELVSGVGSPDLTINENSYILDALIFPMLAAYPANASPDLNSPQSGSLYIVPATPTGDWINHENDLAVYKNDSAGWSFITPIAGMHVKPPNNLAVGLYPLIEFNGSNWILGSVFGQAVISDRDYSTLWLSVLNIFDYENSLYGGVGIYDATLTLKSLLSIYEGSGVLQLIQNDPWDLRVNLVAGQDGYIKDKVGFGGKTDPNYSIDSDGKIRSASAYLIGSQEGFSGVIPDGSSAVVSGGLIVGVTD